MTGHNNVNQFTKLLLTFQNQVFHMFHMSLLLYAEGSDIARSAYLALYIGQKRSSYGEFSLISPRYKTQLLLWWWMKGKPHFGLFPSIQRSKIMKHYLGRNKIKGGTTWPQMDINITLKFYILFCHCLVIYFLSSSFSLYAWVQDQSFISNISSHFSGIK